MAVRAVFPGRYTFQRILLYWPRYFRFFSSCSYTLFALPSSETSDMPRTKSSSAVSQNYFVLVLPSLGYNLLRLGPWAPMNKWARATNYWAPQYYIEIKLYHIKDELNFYKYTLISYYVLLRWFRAYMYTYIIT